MLQIHNFLQPVPCLTPQGIEPLPDCQTTFGVLKLDSLGYHVVKTA